MRFRIGGLMLGVAAMAVGLFSLRYPFYPVRNIVFHATVVVLLAAAIRSRLARDPSARDRSFGFALFDCAHMLLSMENTGYNRFLTARVADQIAESIAVDSPSFEGFETFDRQTLERRVEALEQRASVHGMINCYTSIVLGFLGGHLIVSLHRRQERRPSRPGGTP
jgi:hypothetical protein